MEAAEGQCDKRHRDVQGQRECELADWKCGDPPAKGELVNVRVSLQIECDRPPEFALAWRR